MATTKIPTPRTRCEGTGSTPRTRDAVSANKARCKRCAAVVGLRADKTLAQHSRPGR